MPSRRLAGFAVLLIDRMTRHGTTLLASCVCLGLIWPAAADTVRPAMPVMVFIFVLGTLLRVEPPVVIATARRTGVSVVLPVFVMIACPILVGVAAIAAGLRTDLVLALVLAVSAPPSSGTSAVARMLGLDPAVPLVATLASMALTPLTAPVIADLFSAGSSLAVAPLDLALRLVLLIGSAEGVALLLRRFVGRALNRHARAVDAVVVTALILFALGTMSGARAMIENDPEFAMGVVALAFGCNIFLQLFAALMFPGNLRMRFTTGLIAGNRNVGLLWSALGAAVTPTMALYFAASQLPIFTLPRVIQSVLYRLEAARRTRSAT
ncbi:hypothetical protein P7L78_15860 [Tistrella bauzanensis]|uniref:hypothetical protein n=1 Tax=Tistrella TaxID=171436 RepID=UPI0031F698F1